MTGICCQTSGAATSSTQCCTGFTLIGGSCAACIPLGSRGAITNDQCCQTSGAATIQAGACALCTAGGSSCAAPGAAGSCCGASPMCCDATCADLSSDVNHCGSCTTNCSGLPNVATAGCSAGQCGIVQCVPGMGDCDGVVANGCETPLNSVSDCGACRHVCISELNSLPTCHSPGNTGMTCTLGCNFGFADCDRVYANGCEANLLGAGTSCGACGHVCATNETCMNGACVSTGSCGGSGATCGGAIPCCADLTCGQASTCACTARGGSCDPSSPTNNYGCCAGLNCGPSTMGFECTSNCALDSDNCETRQCCAGPDVCERNSAYPYEAACQVPEPDGCVLSGALCRSTIFPGAMALHCCNPGGMPTDCPSSNFCP